MISPVASVIYIYLYLNHFHELFSPITSVEGHSWSICPDSSRCQGDIEHEKNHIDVADLDVLICQWLYPKMFYAPTHGGFTVENKMGNGCMCTKKHIFHIFRFTSYWGLYTCICFQGLFLNKSHRVSQISLVGNMFKTIRFRGLKIWETLVAMIHELHVWYIYLSSWMGHIERIKGGTHRYDIYAWIAKEWSTELQTY